MEDQTSELNDVAVEQIEAANAEIALKDEVASLKSKLAYMAADFDNYKKRCQREKVDIISSASRELAEDIFPIIDNFQMAQATLSSFHNAALPGPGLEPSGLPDIRCR